MSHPYRATDVETVCPVCQTTITADLELVAQPDAGSNPATVNRLRCPSCGHRFLAPTPLLWHDATAEQAYVYIPDALAVDPDDLINGLLIRYMRGAATSDVPPDYLLSPAIYRDADEFSAKLLGEAESLARDDLLEAAEAFCQSHGAPELVRQLDLLVGVRDLPQFLAAVNEHPELLEPVLVRQLEALGEAAEEQDGAPEVGAYLRDLAAALRLHTPDMGDDDGMRESELVPPDVRAAMAAGDLEAASEYLERPEREDTDDFKRAMLTTNEPELREGFTEHARLFGGMVDSMIDDGNARNQKDRDEAAEDGDGPDELFDGPLPEGLADLLAAPTIDRAVEVIASRPELVSKEAVSTLRQIEQAALDGGDDGRASHVQMLIHTIYIASADEDELEGEPDGS